MRDAADSSSRRSATRSRCGRKGGEIAVEIRFEDLDEALALARSLSAAAAEAAAAGPIPPLSSLGCGRLAQLVRARL